MEILDADRLAEALELDARFHAAKLAAQGGIHGDPKQIWDEHEAVRREIMTPAAGMPRHVLEAQALAFLRRKTHAGAN